MTTTRRALILAVVLAASLAMAATAGAKPPKCDIDPDAPGCGDTEPETTRYDLTLEFIGDNDGLATDCAAGAVVMEYSVPTGGWLSLAGPDDSTEIIEIDVRDADESPFVYTRSLGDPGAYVGLDGCHGPPLAADGNETTKPGHIIVQATDTTIAFLWYLDWYETTVPHPKNPRRTVNAWEHLTLSNQGWSDQPMTVYHPDTGQPGWKVENGTHSAIVSGPFDLYVDGPEPNTSTQHLTFLITITPQG